MAVWRNTTYTDATPNDVPLDEVFWEKDTKVTRQIIVRNATPAVRFQAYKDFLGYATYVPNAKNNSTASLFNYVTRVTPHAYPSPFLNQGQNSFLWATRVVKTEMLGLRGRDTVAAPAPAPPPGGLPVFDACKITLEYSTVPFDVLGDSQVAAQKPSPVGVFPWAPNQPPIPASPFWDPSLPPGVSSAPDEGQALAAGTGRVGGGGRYVVRVNKPSSKILTVPRGLMAMPADKNLLETAPVPIKEGLPYEECRVDVKYTQIGVPAQAYPVKAILSSLNALNNLQFDGYPAGTLMLKYVDPRWYQSAFGDWVVDIEFGMCFAPHFTPSSQDADGTVHYLPTDWNHTLGQVFVPPPAAPDGLVGLGYRLVTMGGSPTGQFPYRLVDFSALFRPDQPA